MTQISPNSDIVGHKILGAGAVIKREMGLWINAAAAEFYTGNPGGQIGNELIVREKVIKPKRTY